jgi:DNA primase
MIDQPTVQRILDATDIVEVVSEFVTLRKRGVNYVGLCPFHDDKTPSFYVSPSKGVCKCFACGKGGSAVHFLMEHQQMSYPEALKWLAKKYHIEVKERELTDKERRTQGVRESLLAVSEFARDYFCHTLQNHADGKSIAQSYFRSRGISDDTIRKFQLGYSTTGRNELAREAMRKGYRKEYLLQSGLCCEKEDGSIRDRFWGRVIFPWHNISGRIVGFGGRVLDSRTKGVSQKYVNSPESEIYSKGRELYGLYQAKQAIAKYDNVYMVEGYTDVIAMHQSGLENVVANSGTALSETQVRMLHRLTSNITLLYDGDEAGIKASLRGVDMLLSEGMNVKVLLLPDGDDPDSFARKHTYEELRQYIAANEQNFISFKTGLLLDESDKDPVKKAQLIQDIARSIGLVPNEILRYAYLKECASLLDTDEQIILNEIERTMADRKGKTMEKPKEEIPTTTDSNPFDTVETSPLMSLETELVRMIVRYGERTVCHIEAENGQQIPVPVVEYIYYDLEPDDLELQNPLHWQMLLEVMERVNNEGFTAERYFLTHPDPKISAIAASLIADRFQLSRSNERDIIKDEYRLKDIVPHLLLEFKLRVLKDEMKELMRQLSLPEVAGDSTKCMEIMQRYKNLGEILKELSKRVGDRIVV